MSYVKTNWVTGDLVTAEKLNNIENALCELVGEPYTEDTK